MHWLDHGIDEGLQACEHFSPSAYLAKNPDVEALCGKGDYKKPSGTGLGKG